MLAQPFSGRVKPTTWLIFARFSLHSHGSDSSYHHTNQSNKVPTLPGPQLISWHRLLKCNHHPNYNRELLQASSRPRRPSPVTIVGHLVQTSLVLAPDRMFYANRGLLSLLSPLLSLSILLIWSRTH